MTGTKYDARRQAELTEQRRTIIKTCESIVGRAKAAGRELTASEQESVSTGLAKIDDTIDPELKTLGKAMVSAVLGLGSSEDFLDGGPGNLFDEQAKNGIIHAVKTRTSYRAELPSKAALTTGTVLPPTGSYVEGGLHPNSEFPLASLFRNQPAAGPVQRFYRMTSGTAAVVAEGALKPDSGISFTAVDLAIAKIACTAQFTDEMAEDAPFLVTFLQSELAASIAAAENAAILNTFNTTSGVLTGTGATATVVDLIADAISGQEAISGKTPVAVIAHPTVVSTIRKAKTSGGGDFMIDPLTSGPTTIHGVRVIPSPATAAGVAWVLEASGVIVYRRNNLTVEVGTSGDDLVKNVKTAVAEERMATAVTRPSSLTKLTLT